ncbi:stalk domain-containing protein [Natranaerobius trueperi]|uniref:Transglutaminase-like domain-containing protein n=1 Tax=Natranaerobius trueperi TaxID=759412 RepID=A0A226C0Y1_9FIRM|nr:stalk domain-containing protein [Natranaerobius trueperi]OWZ84958.1 hypothetical protein CDO51_00705 [Natranaerobius trueperi]
MPNKIYYILGLTLIILALGNSIVSDIDEVMASDQDGWIISDWRSSGGPYGGEITSIAQDPNNPNDIYVGTPEGLFKSFDKGENWYHLGVSDYEINDIAVSSQNPDQVYLGANDGLYISEDGGVTWDFFEGDLKGEKVNFIDRASDPIFRETILVGTEEGAYISRTGGRSFTLIGYEGKNVTAGLIDSNKPEFVFLAVEDKGLVSSDNRGLNWTKLSNDYVGEVLSISVNPAFPYIMFIGTTNGIYSSYDSGVNWDHSGFLGIPVHDIWMDPKSPIHIMIATEGEGVKRSSTGADSWETVHKDLQNKEFNIILKDQDDPDRFFLGTSDVGIVSLNLKEQDFRVLNEGLTTYINNLIVSKNNPDNVVAVSDAEVFFTLDGGNEWSELFTSRPDAIHLWQNKKEDDDEQLYFVKDDTMYISDWDFNLEEIDLSNFVNQIYQISVHPKDSDEIWVGTNEGVYRSKDRGETWEQIGLSDSFIEYLNISYDSDLGQTVLYAGGYSGVYRYHENFENEEADEDKTKEKYGSYGEFTKIIDDKEYAISELEVPTLNPRKVWVGTLGKGVYYSEDAGEGFEAFNTGLIGSEEDYFPRVVDITTYENDPDKVLVALESGIYYSSNRDDDWDLVNDINHRVESLDVHFEPPTSLYIGTSEGVYYHEAYEIPYLGWDEEEHFTLENPEIYRFSEEFKLENETDKTQEDLVFMAPRVLNHGIYQFHYDYDIDPKPEEVITLDEHLEKDQKGYNIDDYWFEIGNELLVFTKDELEPGETWEISVENETVVFETYYDLDAMDPKPYDRESEFYKLYTSSDEVSQSDNETIEELASEVVEGAQGPIEKASKIFDWVKDYLEYVPPGNVGALEAYETGKGVCADYSDLFVALARAEGIPARRLSGYYISGPEDGQYHAWAEFYVEGYGWVPVEPTFEAWYSDYFGEIPDTSHIFMSYGVVRHEFSSNLSFSETFDIERVSLGEMDFKQEDLFELLKEHELSEPETENSDENQDDENDNPNNSYENENVITTKVGSDTLKVGSETISMDVESYIVDGRTMVPLRFIADSMGADVDYLSEEKEVSILLDKKEITLPLEGDTAKVNDKEMELEVAPELLEGRTMVPLRFINEQLGAYVEYENETQKIIIHN